MSKENAGRRLRAGIVGGGRGSFIGSVHRMAAELDGQALLVAGAMSSDPKTARESAASWFLDRSYDSYVDMARAESQRVDGIDFVIVATPNYLHFPVTKAFIECGIAVVCDKPMTLTLEEARALVQLVESSGVPFALTHNYSGYPAVREARERVARGEVGTLRKVVVEYHQDWLMSPLEGADNKQAQWRTDPRRAGVGGCVADIGSHAHHLLEYVTGVKVDSLCADLTSFVDGRSLDDDANILLRLCGGAKGTLTCSQIACGEENRIVLRVYGSEAALEWSQEDANTLILKPAGQPWHRLRAASGYMSLRSLAASRLPTGHPEGYIEAFASLYRDVFEDLRRRARGEPLRGGYPTVHDGLRGMQFIARSVESSQQGSRWLEL